MKTCCDLPYQYQRTTANISFRVAQPPHAIASPSRVHRRLLRCVHARERIHIVRESIKRLMPAIMGVAIHQKNASLCSLTTGIGSKFIPIVY